MVTNVRSRVGGWTWTEDRQWSRSWFSKRIDDDARAMAWQLETRTEESSAGSMRMGVLRLRGSADGELTISIMEERVDDGPLGA